MFVEIAILLPFRNTFTYSVPEELEPFVKKGVRAVVPFKERVLTGFIVKVLDSIDESGFKIKKIYDIIDDKEVISEKQFQFYNWLHNYYLCSLGDALKNAVLSGTEIESENILICNTSKCAELLGKIGKGNSLKSKALQFLLEKEQISFAQLKNHLKKKNIHYLIRSLENEEAIQVTKELKNASVKAKYAKFVKLAKPLEDILPILKDIEKRAPSQIKAALFFVTHKVEKVLMSELISNTGSNSSSIKALELKGIFETFDDIVERTYVEEFTEKKHDIKLTDEQQSVVDTVVNHVLVQNFNVFLLHGVTGSGKTQVYIELAKKAIKAGKTVLIMVPEISLTPQITARFTNEFGDSVTVLHSKISSGKRYDSWRGILNGNKKIVVGPRSAIFAPLENIGLIVVDEEHDSSYKQFDQSPRYNARDCAVMKAKIYNCPIILGSATPSLESMYNAKNKRYTLLNLKNRIDNVKMPQITLIDTKIESVNNRMKGFFSDSLLSNITKRIEKNEGTVLLQNRKGYAPQVFCTQCGEIERCVQCSVPMVYYVNSDILKCHYCNYTKVFTKKCSFCGSKEVKLIGIGTEKVEDELEHYLPDAKIMRIDSESINRKGILSRILNEFKNKNIDVLVGTQMVAKGLDFPHLTLVGVISAEATLWLPDFRADERTFQLLTQVAGRAGRSDKEGTVLIQTVNPSNFVLQKVKENDYEGFYTNELEIRKIANYPPFNRMILVESKDENESSSKGAINDLYKELKKYSEYCEITNPGPAGIYRIKGQYRNIILIKNIPQKDPSGSYMRRSLSESFSAFNNNSRYRDIKIIFDVDPQGMI